MNFAAWLPAIITLVSVIFIAGQVTGRIKDQEKTLEKHDGRLNAHDSTLIDHAVRIARSEGFTQGFNAGSHHDKHKTSPTQ
jgi:hypothetical protein